MHFLPEYAYFGFFGPNLDVEVETQHVDSSRQLKSQNGKYSSAYKIHIIWFSQIICSPAEVIACLVDIWGKF
ncbi:MAG: hypothetical protein DRP00_05130 [Candidatus Aenigmatarchaeota archaeon]|nr:MAG: hypothetical protein DRP00_05130 [Candidatus Aenigmarchaeota archaeon]